MHSLKTVFNILSLLLLSHPFAAAQQDVAQCALNCIANVNGTTCSQAQWSCLCADRMYIERVNNCTYKACDKADEDITFGAVAQICRVFGYTLTYGPEATASTQSDQIFSTQGILSESSLPSVLSSTISDFPTGTDGYTIATAPASPTSSGTTSSAAPASTTAAPPSTISSGSGAAATSSSGAGRNLARLGLAVMAAANIIFHH